MKVAILLGLPGAGKSTLARQISEKFGYGILSSDEIREHKFGDRFSESIQMEVLNTIFSQCGYLLSNGSNIIIDSTFFNKHDNRLKLYDYLSKVMLQPDIILIQISTPIDVCIKRDEARPINRRVGENVINQLASKFDPPSQSEKYIIFLGTSDINSLLGKL